MSAVEAAFGLSDASSVATSAVREPVTITSRASLFRLGSYATAISTSAFISVGCAHPMVL